MKNRRLQEIQAQKKLIIQKNLGREDEERYLEEMTQSNRQYDDEMTTLETQFREVVRGFNAKT